MMNKSRKIFFDPYHRKELLNPTSPPKRGVLKKIYHSIATYKMGIDPEALWGDCWGSQRIYDTDLLVITNCYKSLVIITLIASLYDKKIIFAPINEKTNKISIFKSFNEIKNYVEYALNVKIDNNIYNTFEGKLEYLFDYSIAERESKYECLNYLNRIDNFSKKYYKFSTYKEFNVNNINNIIFEETYNVVEVIFSKRTIITNNFANFNHSQNKKLIKFGYAKNSYLDKNNLIKEIQYLNDKIKEVNK